jgi:GNAT superfamily N-acetyltransferase
MLDGGRSAASGFLYQYVRTIEALLDVADLESVAAVYVEGRPGSAGELVAESVDYELVDHAGVTLAAVQVKSRRPGGSLGPSEVFGALAGLVHDRDAPRYELITNAIIGGPAARLVEILSSERVPGELRRRIGEVLSAAGADRAQARLGHMDDQELQRLRRAVVIVDPREDAVVHAILKARLRRYRNDHRKGLGDASAGLMAGYLIGEILRGAAAEGRARFTVAEFRSLLLIEGAALRSALSRRDWGVVVGPVPGWPDIHRGSLVEQIADALPSLGDGVAVGRCTITGMSGIGKSSLAAAFILDQADLYDVIYWVDAENDAALVTSFTRVLAHLAGTDGAEVSDSAQLRARVHDLLARSSGRWLMVLDNCVGLRSMEPWIPRAGGGHVIVTSTDDTAGGAGAKIAVGPMNESEATALLAARLAVGEGSSRRDLELVSQLAHAMECWPLALELAAAYIEAGGMRAGGIPQYLAALKMRSLDHSRAVPKGYPRTLVEAIFLSLERIESLSGRRDDPPGVAATAMWFAAYLSSRKIPVHLLITAVMMDPESAGGFRVTTPAYMSPSVCPEPEVVSILRSESLVSLDEPLPPDGAGGFSVPGVTVSVNSVLQEVLRHRRDADPRAIPVILGRLAYHVTLWLANAHRWADYQRTLVFAAHAATIHEHAVRLGADGDYIAFMGGNLAPVLQRRGDSEQAAALLRAEITQLSGRSADYCVQLCCQAEIMLAGVLADAEPPDCAEILRLLGSAFVVLQPQAPDVPARVAELALGIQGTLRRIIPQRWGPDGILIRDLARLEAVVTDLLAHLPGTTIAACIQWLQDAETAFRSDNPAAAIELCRRALTQIACAAADSTITYSLQPQAQRLLIEALIDSGDMNGARRELSRFWSITEPAELYATRREELLLKAGQALALKWLTSDEPLPAMTELLAFLIAPDIAGPTEAAFPGQTAACIQLLRAVSALAAHDDLSASAHLEIAHPALTSAEGRSAGNIGWVIIARLTRRMLAERSQNTVDHGEIPAPAGDAPARSPSRRQGPEGRATSRSSSSFSRNRHRFIAPDLLLQGLPGPGGTWIRRPRPGEHNAINELLWDADDELAPWIIDAIDDCTLSCTLTGMLTGQPLEDLATELCRGGPEAFMSGFTVVLVAATPDRRLIGAIQASPPVQLLEEVGQRGIPAARQRAGAAAIIKISGIAVAPSHRGTGVGKSLATAASDLSWRTGRQLVYGQFRAGHGLDRFFTSCGFDICDDRTAIDLTSYGVPAVITPQPGNQFFASHFDLTPSQE